jgi:hypothetical protein
VEHVAIIVLKAASPPIANTVEAFDVEREIVPEPVEIDAFAPCPGGAPYRDRGTLEGPSFRLWVRHGELASNSQPVQGLEAV